jgi:hypothetical protein
MNIPKVKPSVVRFVVRLLLLTVVGTSLAGCYPVGHRYHTEDEHAESMQRMTPQDPPNTDYYERWR